MQDLIKDTIVQNPPILLLRGENLYFSVLRLVFLQNFNFVVFIY